MNKETKTRKYTALGLTKLAVNAFFLAVTLSFVVAFVGEDFSPMYGTSITYGLGLIAFVISWLAWMPSLDKDKLLNVPFIVTILFAVIAPVLLPTVLTFVMAGVAVVIVAVFPFITKYIAK